MFEKLLQRVGRSPDRYPDVEPSSGDRAYATGRAVSWWWATAIGAALALAGGAGAVWGLLYLRGALSPDNASNPLREIGIAIGVGVTLLGGLPCLGGIALVAVSIRPRRRT